MQNFIQNGPCCKSFKLLGFISRISQVFFSPHALLKSLNCAFVHPIVEYGSVLWDPNTSAARDMIESVQRVLFRMVSFRHNILIKTAFQSNRFSSSIILLNINFGVSPGHAHPFVPFHVFRFPINSLKICFRVPSSSICFQLSRLLHCAALACKSLCLARAIIIKTIQYITAFLAETVRL